MPRSPACLAALAALVVIAGSAGAQQPTDTTRLPELVVTATRLAEDRDAVPATVTVLRGEELREQGIHFVLDGLRQVPGVQMVQQGSLGGVASLFLRGGESDYVKVLVDGVPVNQPGGAYDFAYLSTDNVDRIEIVRGPASVLYGSDAVTGVVQIFTRQPDGATRVSASGEGGTYGTVRWDVGAGGGGEPFNWSAAVSRYTTDGIYDFNNDYRNTVASAAMRVRPDARTDATLSLRYNDGVFHFPTDFVGTPVDRNQFTSQSATTVGLDAGHRFADWVEGRVALGLNSMSTGAENLPDPTPGPSDSFSSRAELDRRTVDLRAIVRPSRVATLMAGVGYDDQAEQSFGSYDKDRTNWGYYLQATADPTERVSLTAGARVDDNERFGTFFTYRLGALGRITGTARLRASVGTAFKEPSFFENFATGFVVGNPDLDPERATSWELGAEQDLAARRVTLSATYFNQLFKDLIQYSGAAPPGTPNYLNVAEARAFGVELGVTTRPVAGLTIGGSYTRLVSRVIDAGFDTGDDANFVEGEPLLRRPGHTASLLAAYDWNGRARIGAVTTFVGRRDDLRFGQFPEPTRRMELPSYTTVDLSAVVVVLGGVGRRPPVRLIARVANLFDEEYEQVANYPSPGRTITVGAAVGTR